ncbi:MAG: vitamin K epoxide reductase family protein [Bdellovibrionota bacterium]
MSKKLNYLLLSFIASAGVYAYLSYHHYMVKLGLGGTSLCQVSETINCDVAALSKYAEILTIPIAVIGLSYSIIMLGVFLFAKFGWFEETEGYKTIVKTLTALSAVFSLVLLFISVFQLKAFCPFCIAGYVLSFIIVFLTWSLYSDSKFNLNISAIALEKGFLGTLLAVPLLAWFISGSVRDSYGLDQMQKIVPEKIFQWQKATAVTFDNTLGLVKGSSEATAPVLVEFADFKCPHCKTAANTIKNYLAGNKNVKMIFKPYPLDGVCNPHMPQKGDGSRCELAGWAICGEKLFAKGWDIHYWIFDHQESMMSDSDLSSHLQSMGKDLGIDTAQLKTCATSAETFDIIKKSAAEGEAAKITGTPSIFVNGKKLEYGQFIDVLRGAIGTLQ